MDEREWLAERFEERRTRLRAVAYRMLGSLSEADDAVQEAWLRLSRADTSEVENLDAWLTTVVARVSLNMLRSRTCGARSRSACTCPSRSSTAPTDRPRARGAARRLGRARPARGPRDADPRRAARVRPARHVRRAVRRDRADRRPLPRGGPPARQPRPPPRPGRAHGPRRGPRRAARGRRRVPRRRARGRLRGAARGARPGRRAARRPRPPRRIEGGPRGGGGRRPGAHLLAARPVIQPALVNGAAGASRRATASCSRSGASRSGAGASSRSTSSPTPRGSPGST